MTNEVRFHGYEAQCGDCKVACVFKDVLFNSQGGIRILGVCPKCQEELYLDLAIEEVMAKCLRADIGETYEN